LKRSKIYFQKHEIFIAEIRKINFNSKIDKYKMF